MRHLSRFAILLSLITISLISAWAVDQANCNASFTACQIRENILLQLPCCAIAGDVIVQEAGSTTVSDVFRVFNNMVDTGAGTGFGNLVILYSSDDNLPLPATYSANAVIIKESAGGSTVYTNNGTAYTLDTAAVPTRLVYTGSTTADYHDPAQLSATLTILSSRLPIANATVNFTLGPQTCAGTTNASGIASCSLTLTQPVGNDKVTATFAGIFGVDAGTTTSVSFVVTNEQTTLSYTGDTLIANGGTAHMSGVLLEDNVTPIASRTVTFTLGAGGTAQTCNGVTDAAGKAACNISPVVQPLGPGTVSDHFAGDAFYLPASASAGTMVFAFLSSGSFVLGNLSAQVGTQAEFWGAQWASVNQLSGGAAPADFKGFAATLSSAPPACGGAWLTGPGNSSQPPASVPSYMAALVTPAVTPSGSTPGGRTASIVIVKTDPGYSSDPGHLGTGTVVAKVCP